MFRRKFLLLNCLDPSLITICHSLHLLLPWQMASCSLLRISCKSELFFKYLHARTHTHTHTESSVLSYPVRWTKQAAVSLSRNWDLQGAGTCLWSLHHQWYLWVTSYVVLDPGNLGHSQIFCMSGFHHCHVLAYQGCLIKMLNVVNVPFFQVSSLAWIMPETFPFF